MVKEPVGLHIILLNQNPTKKRAGKLIQLPCLSYKLKSNPHPKGGGSQQRRSHSEKARPMCLQQICGAESVVITRKRPLSEWRCRVRPSGVDWIFTLELPAISKNNSFLILLYIGNSIRRKTVRFEPSLSGALKREALRLPFFLFVVSFVFIKVVCFDFGEIYT